MRHQRKGVRFGGVSFAKEAVYFLDETQKPELWVSDEELKEMHRRARRLITDSARTCTEEEESVRGLELAGNRLQQRAVRAVHLLMLDQQQENRDMGYPGSKGLKALSLRLTRHDVADAILKATQDALVASCIYKESIDAALVDPCFT